MIVALITSGICLLFEMFFAAAEISIVSCDRLAVRKAARDGERAARLIERFLENKPRLLATTLAGTQLAVVVSTVVMTYALHHHHPQRAALWLLGGLTPVLVVLGEIVPKALAQQHADATARFVVYPLWLAETAFAPLVEALAAFSGWLMRSLGVPERKIVTREELELLVTGLSNPSKGSEITEGEQHMISNIFDFANATVADVMVPLSDVVALSEDADLRTAATEIEEKQYTRFPIYRERIDRIVGTVHAFDVLKAGDAGAKVGSIARAPIFVPRSQLAVDLLFALQRARQGMAIVVDEYGGAVGITTIEDILEEVVGEIEDEHDDGPPAVRKEAEGLWRVSARTRVAEVNRQLRLELPEGEDYESIAGLLLEKLKHIPHEGESVRLGSAVLRVTRASERAVEEIQIRLIRRGRSLSRGAGTTAT
jgi:putative hemolysin